MLDLSAARYTVVNLIRPASLANTAAATSAWTAVSAYDGPIIFIHNIGAVTGSMAAKIQTADDASGTNAADVVSFTNVSAANKEQAIVVDSAKLGPYVAYIGTVTTGPIVGGVLMLACNQYA